MKTYLNARIKKGRENMFFNPASPKSSGKILYADVPKAKQM